MDSLASRTAAAVASAIEAADQTVLGVSEEAGIPRTTLIRRLRGQSAFTIAELEAIAPAVGCTVGDLLASAASPCSCGSDASSLDPSEIVVHRTGGPCTVEQVSA